MPTAASGAGKAVSSDKPSATPRKSSKDRRHVKVDAPRLSRTEPGHALVSGHSVLLVDQQGVQLAAVLRDDSRTKSRSGGLLGSRRSEHTDRGTARSQTSRPVLPRGESQATVVQLGTRYSTLRLEHDEVRGDVSVRFAVGRLEASVGVVAVPPRSSG